ncbi:MAG: hypothetical protein E6G34_03570 [Actinobacteria bacterium]|nr:MAG: hypothetical protein E6G34_03570 [Actinomycetota bacterium]
MATRTIVTSQPDVACDVCERRLLRGEQPELFLAAGQPRTVCDLCVPRAVHNGWLRESEQPLPAPAAPRPRRGRSLFERLRAAARPGEEVRPARAEAAHGTAELEPYDFLSAGEATDAAGTAADEQGAEEPNVTRLAVELFNAGEHPRRIAGLMRSLGDPTVSVLPVDGVDGLVSVVVAWELCWYRYRIDVDDPGAGIEVVQGTELAELSREECVANAVADALGVLALLQ